MSAHLLRVDSCFVLATTSREPIIQLIYVPFWGIIHKMVGGLVYWIVILQSLC